MKNYKINKVNRRFIFLSSLKGITFGLLTWRLFDLQIIENKKYKKLSENNQFNFSLVPPERGEIYDAKGRVLAANRDAFSLFIKLSAKTNIKQTLKKIFSIINLNNEDTENLLKTIRQLKLKRKINQNIFITNNLSSKDISKLAVRLYEYPEVKFLMSKKRVYPQGGITSHIVGYIGKFTNKDVKKNKNYQNLPGLYIGKTGLENFFDNKLRGSFGRKREEVTATGTVINSNLYENPIPGENLKISIDLNIQSYALNRLEKGNSKVVSVNSSRYKYIKSKYKIPQDKTIFISRKGKLVEPESGSVIVMNVETGQLLCCVSSPNYNPNIFSRGIRNKEWDSIISNKKSPLLNRSVAGLYPPGSTIKMAVALAALESGIIGYNTRFFCSGFKEYGNMKFHCWFKHGHGNLNLSEAIERSCDVYFYELGLKVGIDKISQMLKKLGLSSNLNFELNQFKKGLVPSKKWKLETKGSSWAPGETINASIGQGYMLSSPMELVTMMSRLANEKYAVEPTFLFNANKSFKKLNLNLKHLSYIKNAMIKVVNSKYGTAFNSKLERSNIMMAGKTGTVQVVRITEEEREKGIIKNEDRIWKKRDHALFVGYAPTDRPRYSICVVVEHGGSGSSMAAPIAKDIMNKIFT